MVKNKLFIIVLTLCIISMLAGLISPLFNNSENNNDKGKDKAKSNISKILNSNKVAVISLNGVINSTPENNIFVEENSSLVALRALNQAEDDENVKGVILRINSPGGTVGMSQRLYSAVMNLRKKKPVIAVLDDIAASGGYYVASAADRIIALEGTMTGSIGVIMSTTDAHELLTNKLGISQNVIKSGKFKDIGSSTRAMTKEERQLLQDMVNDSYQQFKEAITKGRIDRKDKYNAPKAALTKNNLNKYADGRIFTGRQALKLGFVDSTGGNREAKDMMLKILADKGYTKDNIDFADYGKTSNFLSSLGLNQKTTILDGLVPASVKYARKPLYLWE